MSPPCCSTSRFRQPVRHRSAARRAARGATRRSAAPTACTPSSLRHRVHRAARMPTGAPGCTGSGRRRCTSRSRRIDARPDRQPLRRRCRRLAQPAALGSAADAARADRLRRGPRDDGRQRRPRRAGRRCGIHCVRRQPLDAAARFFYDADGEMLIVPQQGRLRFATELGVIDVEPQEIVVIPRGVRFRVELPATAAGARLRLRELRRAVPPAGPRADRLERPGQPARLPDAGRARTRTRRATSSWSRKFGGQLWSARDRTTRRSTSSPGTATTRRTSTTCAASTPSARSATTIPIRRSSWCCTSRQRHAGRRATSTS